MLFANAGHNPVIHDHAVFAQHDAVGASANPHIADIVRIDALKKFHGVRTLNIDLAKRRGIEHSD